MSIRLEAHATLSIALDVMAYQFPDAIPASDDDWDCNWLQVRGTISHPAGNWQFIDPCLSTYELIALAAWLKRGMHGRDDKPCFFTEPCLCFDWSLDPEPAIRITLSHEAAPRWLTHEARMNGISLLFPLAQNDCALLAASVEALLEQYPPRIVQ